MPLLAPRPRPHVGHPCGRSQWVKEDGIWTDMKIFDVKCKSDELQYDDFMHIYNYHMGNLCELLLPCQTCHFGIDLGMLGPTFQMMLRCLIFLSLLSVGVAQGSPRRRSGDGGYHPHSYPHSYDSRRRFDSRGGGDGDGGGIPCEGSCRTWVAGGAMVIMLGTIVGVLAWATSNARREAREPEIDRMNSGIAMTDSFVQNPATGAGVELPTGLWKGHYSGSDGLKHKVEFNLKFEDGVVQGDGLDDVGVYSIQGRYQGDDVETFFSSPFEL